ncbi:hypothetical protein [Clostridium uliginosum]|uniref:Uncharacterized protein n=1 Tax=Clostridium uliginosum TaxID=119641 RepID=A0A1I1K0T2_9CLOT|nr:hypothetical protein [Clostridium uliginosum]SFC51593.1 hypothetical protein SAMN05421842_104155 [Clostridium uliginosum]
MYIFLIILSIMSVITTEYIATAFIDFSILNLNFWVVIPAGSILIGMFLGWACSKAFNKSNKKFKKWHCLIVASVAIITFLGINYMEYRTTYLSDDYTTSRTFEGTPISEFIYTNNDGTEVKMNFINYQKYLLDNLDSTIKFKSGTTAEVKTSGQINYIVYFLQIIFMIIFAIFYFVINLSNLKYCDKCRRYHTVKHLFNFSPLEYDTVMNKLEDINYYALDLKELGNTKKKKSDSDVYFKVELSYCSQCKSGEIIIKKHKGNNSDNIKNISIDNSLIESLI